MSERLTPEEVARLDPFGVRKIPASEELRSLLAESKPGESEVKMSEIIIQEKNEWRRVLGISIKVQPLPPFVTKEVMRNLKRFGLELRFIPALDLDLSILQDKGVDKFLQELNRRYPNWKPYKSLDDKEKLDYTVVRNLREWYWERVKDGAVPLPDLPGFWLAVETMEKPAWEQKYAHSLLTDKLGFPDRFGVSWNDTVKAIDKTKQSILSEIGLSGRADIRLLEILEWNLLANRFGWGKTNAYERTNSEYRGLDRPGRLVVGNSDDGGAAYVLWTPPDYADPRDGFRVAVVFGSWNPGCLELLKEFSKDL